MSASRRTATLLALLLAAGLVAPLSRPARAANEPGRGLRTLILVRHGVYDEDDPRDAGVGKALLAEGREQARLTGARLAAWPERVDALYASPLTRARETAEIVAGALPGLAPRPVPDLAECTPGTYRQDIMAGLGRGEADSCEAQLERAFARFFRSSPARDSTEVLVCHGNVIRYLTCRALGADPKLWLGMSLANCSLTVIQVKPDGTFRITAVGDRGHLPPALQTWAMPKPPPRDSTARR